MKGVPNQIYFFLYKNYLPRTTKMLKFIGTVPFLVSALESKCKTMPLGR